MLENVGLEIEFVGHIQQEIHSYMLWHYLKQCLCPSGPLYQKTMSFIAEEGLILKEVWPLIICLIDSSWNPQVTNRNIIMAKWWG